MDKYMYSEYLSFPTIFCGKQRPDNKERKIPVPYSTVCKWELRCQDRRVAMSVPNIFYKLKKNCKSSKFKLLLLFLSESVKQRGKTILLVT